MHRQSLSSPASKLHGHGVLTVGAGSDVIEDGINNGLRSEDLQNHQKDNSASSSAAAANDEQHKSQKPHQQKSILYSSSSSSSSRLIHLIPLLTFFCFLILYLSSHDPATNDLPQFVGLTTLSSEKAATDVAQFRRTATVPSKKAAIDSSDIDNFGGRFLENEEKDVLALGSLRSLKEREEISKQYSIHRKFGH